MTTQSVQLPVRDQARSLAVVPLPAPSPEPPGPRAVALALVRLGLVSGETGAWKIDGADNCLPVRVALTVLAREGAIDPMVEGPHRLTEHGEALYGPDLRQRRWLSTR